MTATKRFLNKHQKASKSKKGFTLLEVLLSLVIFVIVIVGVVSGVVLSQNIIIDNNFQNKASSQAQELADELMEMVKGQNNADVNSIDFNTIYNGTAKKLSSSDNFAYDANNLKQFKITYDDSKAIKGYVIDVTVYVDAKHFAEVTAFAPANVIVT